MRKKKHQDSLRLIAVCDGDNVGVARRKSELNEPLVADGSAPRQPTEKIATPIPTWSIETWLLHLLGEQVQETASEKQRFERQYANTGNDEEEALQNAAGSWRKAQPGSASLDDAKLEFSQIDL